MKRQGKSRQKLDPSSFNLELFFVRTQKYVDTYCIRLSNYITPNTCSCLIQRNQAFERLCNFFCFITHTVAVPSFALVFSLQETFQCGHYANCVAMSIESFSKDFKEKKKPCDLRITLFFVNFSRALVNAQRISAVAVFLL